MTKRKITLIESEEKEPELSLKLRPGTSIELVEFRNANKPGESKPGRAALCGYGNACLALIEVGDVAG